MKRIMFFLGAVIMAVTITLVGAAVLNNTFVWNNTFDVTQPNILCNINVGEYRIVNIPVSVNVSLGLQKTIFSDDFESCDTGMFPYPQWTLAFDGNGNEYQTIVDNVSASPTKSLQLMGNINWAGDAVRFFNSSSPTLGYEVKVRVDNSTGIAQYGAYNDAARVGFYKIIDSGHAYWYECVTFTYDGSIVASNSADFPHGAVLQSYVQNQWYDIKVIVDRPNKLFSVWVNGTLEGQNLQSSENPYIYEGLALSGRYTETINNFDDVSIFEAAIPASSLANTSINGTLTVELQDWNTTTSQWQHIQYFQQPTNITLAGGEYTQKYAFTPTFEGKFNVKVTFAYDSTVDTFNG